MLQSINADANFDVAVKGDGFASIATVPAQAAECWDVKMCAEKAQPGVSMTMEAQYSPESE